MKITLLFMLVFVYFAPGLYGNGDSEFYRDFDWHIEGATYAAFIRVVDDDEAEFLEIVGTRKYTEIFVKEDLNALRLKAGDSLVLFIYDHHLKQVAFGNRTPRYTSRILYRSVSFEGQCLFTRWNHRPVSEIRKLIESKYHPEFTLKTSDRRI